MNLIYRLIWNPCLAMYVPAHRTARCSKLIFAACLALGLVACGGGGGGSSDAASSTLSSANALKAKPVVADPTLVGQEISLVNTTTAGDQVFGTIGGGGYTVAWDAGTIGALSDGGYTVAWVSGTSTFLQRYDSEGAKVGDELSIPFPEGFLVLNGVVGATAVLTGGDAVVVYLTRGAQGLDISFSRFDASGVLVAQGVAASTADYDQPYRPGYFGYFHVSPPADGGFVVGWTVDYRRDAESKTFVRRYDSQAAPVGSNILVNQITGNTDFQFAADAEGGYSVTLFYAGSREYDVLRIVHLDANGTMTTIVPPHLGDARLLPLAGDRFVLFAMDSSSWTGSPVRQFLDSAGNPVGDPVPIPALPFEAKELVDGGFVVFWNMGGSITAQRFDSAGAPMGDLLTLGSNGVVPGVVALADGGFASAWSAPSAAGDLDVFTQRFIEVLSHDQAALRAKRKACLASAKGMIGRERKAFMDACMQ